MPSANTHKTLKRRSARKAPGGSAAGGGLIKRLPAAWQRPIIHGAAVPANAQFFGRAIAWGWLPAQFGNGIASGNLSRGDSNEAACDDPIRAARNAARIALQFITQPDAAPACAAAIR